MSATHPLESHASAAIPPLLAHIEGRALALKPYIIKIYPVTTLSPSTLRLIFTPPAKLTGHL